MSRTLLPLALMVCLFLARTATAAEAPAPVADAKAQQQAVAKAVEFLTKSQAPNGSFAGFAGPGVTAVVVTGLLRNGLGVDDPLVAKALKYLEGMVQPDGGIYPPKSMYRNYETCLSAMAFAEANRDGRYAKTLKAAEAFLKKEQWDEGEGHDRSSPYYGGAGYGRSERPDLSNTQFLVETLRALGDGPEDPAIQKALVFVSRCQNFESEHNTTGHPAKNPDGGFYYTGAAGGSSQAGTLPNGGLRSYGSMTYAGLKSMIFAGVGPDDPRVKAAYTWIKKYYGVTENPGIGNAGLYYYYQTFAKALATMQVDTIEDANGIKHDWRQELAAELLRRQKPDGSWVNENSKWLEGEPALVTGYALLALAHCRPKEAKK